MLKDKRGGIVIALSFLVGLVIVSIVFLSFVYVVIVLIDAARNMSGVASNANAMVTISRVEWIWYVTPVLIIILLAVWAINKAMQRDTVNY